MFWGKENTLITANDTDPNYQIAWLRGQLEYAKFDQKKVRNALM